MTTAQRERAALVEALRQAGPDAPTLCEGWTTRDLAAHLVIREYRPDSMPGLAIPLLAGYTAKVQEQVAESTPYEEMLAKIASGPPVFSPLKLVDSVVNTGEMFIHHEDVRRAAPEWEPREIDDETVAALRRTLQVMARATLSRMPGRVALRTPEGQTLLTAGSGPTVTVTGDPAELLLFAVGRKARVDIEGDDETVRAVREAPKGL